MNAIGSRSFILCAAIGLAACASVGSNQNQAPAPHCGNLAIEAGEACDDGPLNSDQRPDACRSNCQLPTCGDAVVDTGEGCDGAVPGGRSCATEGYAGGALICTATCQLLTTNC